MAEPHRQVVMPVTAMSSRTGRSWQRWKQLRRGRRDRTATVVPLRLTATVTGLRTRPSAETFPLEDLVALAREGSIRVPAFQRGLK